jgi:tRNA threonylcarbamoyladenosine biosynthesis protein TsaE
MLEGALGAGKTTLVRGLVAALPGGEEAEVSSPSFNVLNLYPTTPPTAHFDLYRLENQPPDESLLECIEAGAHLLLIEWPQYLPRRHWPASYLRLRWRPAGGQEPRTLELDSAGAYAAPYFEAIRRAAALFSRR